MLEDPHGGTCHRGREGYADRQIALGTRGEPQVFDSAKPVLAEIAVKERDAVPVLVTVMTCVALVEPHQPGPRRECWWRKGIPPGHPGPVPASGTTWVLPLAPLLLSVTVKVP